ncbi:MAG: hypothetical protein KC583_16070, partial [Myxococcales bacterium]|nr:hypothetical protein [Myxococcales bacterium]
VILRFDADGQCLQLDATGRGLGNFPCRRAQGRFIGNGSRIFTAYIDDATFNIRVGALFDTEGGFGIGRIETVNLVDFPTVDGARPVVTVRNIDPNVGQLQLRVATVDGLWESDATWLSWPWQDARAVVPRGDTAYVVRFDGGPRLETLSLTERDFGAEPVYRLDVDDQCPPSVERCDGVDQDCDGRADDGLCCTQDDRRIDAPLQRPEGAPREFLITSVENGDAYRVAVRVAEDVWQLYVTAPRADPAMTRVDLLKEMGLPDSQARIAGAYAGRAFVAAGGYNLLLADDSEGRLTAFWHRDRPVCPPDMPGCEPGERTTDFKAPFPVPCERVLAVDVIDHTTDNASALLACGDGLHRLYARSEVQDRFWSYRDLGIDVDGVDWVTITRQAEDVSTLLVGYESSLGSPTLSSLFFVANANGPPQLRAVDANLLQQGELLRDPVWLPTALGAPPVRIADGNAEVMLREGRGEQLRVTWLPVQTGAVDAESQFAITTSLVVTAAPTEPPPGEAQATGFWMVDVRGDNGLNLWSTEPSVVLPGPKPLWRVIQHPARILQPQGVVPRDLETFATLEPEGDTWRLRTYRVDCRPL